MATFAERVRELRKEKGLNQSQLAEALHTTVGTVSIWERGVRFPEITTMERISSFFDVSLPYLLGTAEGRQSQSDAEDRKVYSESAHDGLLNNMIVYSELGEESKAVVEKLIWALYEADKIRGLLIEPSDGLKEELENLFHNELLK